MSGLRQPVLGVLATGLIVLVSWGFIALFDFVTFATWVSYFLMCVIPVQILIAIAWGGAHPAFAADRPQPLRGVLLTMLALAAGAALAVVLFLTVGGGVGPPTPYLVMYAITMVVVTFWATIMFGGWPFNVLLKNPVASGIVMLLACYVINYGLFVLLFDFAFLEGSPVHVAALDPQGLFYAWDVLVFFVTVIAAMFVVLNFDLWPMTASPGLMRQPVLGLVWTVLILVIGGAAFVIGTRVLGMDVVGFMVTVPIPFIFGTIVIQNMLQASLFSGLSQPVKGVVNLVAAMVTGAVLSMVYRAVAPVLSGPLDAGPPGYDMELWLASALLAVTFPFLILFAEFFRFWPLSRVRPAVGVQNAAG